MRVLVAYASRYGATEEITKRISEKLAATGHEAQARPVKEMGDLADYEAFIIGSATYFGKWLREATKFIRQNRAILAAGRPVWLFSTGPLGTAATDAQGRDLRAVAEPKEIAEFREAIHPRDHRVFFGVLDPGKLGFRDRLIKALPAGRALLPEGDFRDWAEIEAWVAEIASELTPAPNSRPTGGDTE
ncbi:MAG: flavodoxin domain-containing protein [Actinomycetota bacterium]|nr:flavodoxin domain-containing protein [Actinomycetota bacterium]